MDDKTLRRHLTNTISALAGLLLFTLIEATALWRAGRYWEQARWTAAECLIIASALCLLGIVSVLRIRKQILTRSSS